jgi:hypothetical protein
LVRWSLSEDEATFTAVQNSACAPVLVEEMPHTPKVIDA